MKIKKKTKFNFYKKIFFVFLILIISIFFTELFSRILIFSITKNSKSFVYGINKNIKIDINHLIRFKINLLDLRELNTSIEQLNSNSELFKKNDNNKIVWVFGGSTTRGFNCGDNASSWPHEIKKISNNLLISNYGENGIDSYRSYQIFQKKVLQNKIVPDLILWAHKFNEVNIIYQGVKKDPHDIQLIKNKKQNRKIIFQLLKIESTIENNFLFYKILKNIIITSNRKILRKIVDEQINPNFDKEDFEFALENFKINTQKAIDLSKKVGIKKFVLVSLPYKKKEYKEKMPNLFFLQYYKSIKDLKKIDNVKFIELSENDLFLKNESELFCDEMHKTLKGNIKVAYLLDKYIQEILENE